MAEGVDQAASAFQAEIAPQPSRPRDEGGRFTASARPEPMFAERPVEGDPDTGDISDGGEDQRLRENERRQADGWVDEGDEARVRARRAANDNQRTANDNQPPERIGEHPDDEEAGGEDKPEGDDKPEEQGPKYEVTVEGQTLEVTLPEALKGYVREQTFYSRMHKVAQAAQAVEQEAATTVQTRDAYMQRLELLHRTLSSLSPQIDWNQEFAADPRSAHQKLQAAAQIQGQVQWAAQEMQREQQARAEEYDRNAAKYANDQFSRFVQEANIPDEKALNSEMSGMRAYAKSLGFTEGEIATVYDKRMLLVLRDAARYRQSTAEQPKPVQPGKGRALVPGASTPQTREVGKRSIDEAMNKLAKSGRLDDAASVFQRLLR